MKFKPMLATAVEDTSTIRYPVLTSYKYDGVRAMMQDGVLVSRNLKPIANLAVQERFKGLPEGADGELIMGDPASKNEDGESDAFRKTTSAVMSRSNDSSEVKFYIFDRFTEDPFRIRFARICNGANLARIPHLVVVEQKTIYDEKELLTFEADVLEAGYEGLMLRDPDGPYKQGRATVKQGWLLKLKRDSDSECEILDFVELMRNENEAKTNELGRTQRSSAKAGLVPGGMLGKFLVRDIHTGAEFDIGGGLTFSQRKDYWENRLGLPGKILKYKYFPVGVKDKPRFPVIIGFRDKADM